VTFDEFVQAELGSLTRFAGAMTGDEHLAQDVLSDALLKTVVRWRRISVMENPAADVRRILVTTYLSDRRKALRRRTDPTGDLSLLDRPAPDGSDLVMLRDELERLLAQLTPTQRIAIVLRYLLDQDDKQIAETLNRTTATVRSHLSHARATLRLAGPELADRA
jgi:RNA polymerase sigma factor (sigma-70 family)